jgi:carboxylate-amine ligase
MELCSRSDRCAEENQREPGRHPPSSIGQTRHRVSNTHGCGIANNDEFQGGSVLTNPMTAFRFGIEEEYFISDLRSRSARNRMPKRFLRACQKELGGAVTTEMLQSQIEVTTTPCESMEEARHQLRSLRGTLALHAKGHGLGVVAAATHPLAFWREQKSTQKDRYGMVMADLQMVGRRDMMCGMHVHVEIPDPANRVNLMQRAVPFLPILLALSTSSPFWQGHPTGLHGYRLAAYDELPRSGLPDLFTTFDEYQHYVDTLVAAGVIKDASYVWWVIRPSLQHPTLELRIADVCTRVDDAICIAAVFRCLMRHLSHNLEINAGLGPIERAITAENKWRAQRYGTAAHFIQIGSTKAVPIKSIVAELIELLDNDAQALGCREQVAHAAVILKRGSSADQQLRIYEDARTNGLRRIEAIKNVVDWIQMETLA